MVRVLFWNINGKALAIPIRKLCDAYDVDVLVLAECKMSSVELLPTLNANAERIFISPFNPSTRLSFCIRLPDRMFNLVSDSDYCAIREIIPPVGEKILLVAIHYPSKLFTSNEDQSLLMPRIMEQINEAERQHGHMRTVLVGDLNMNPFEAGVCGSEGLHAVMCKSIAKKGSRTVYGQERPFFYNPMWNFLGDESAGPPGTYYYQNGVIAYFWNTFDQVLYRPALLDAYRESDVSIVTQIDDASLLTNGRLARDYSDHLPLFFTVRT